MRVFYLLSNAISVVGEVNSTTSIDEVYKNAICASPYDGLVDACEKLILNNLHRDKVAKYGFEIISQMPQSVFTENLINDSAR